MQYQLSSNNETPLDGIITSNFFEVKQLRTNFWRREDISDFLEIDWDFSKDGSGLLLSTSEKGDDGNATSILETNEMRWDFEDRFSSLFRALPVVLALF